MQGFDDQAVIQVEVGGVPKTTPNLLEGGGSGLPAPSRSSKPDWVPTYARDSKMTQVLGAAEFFFDILNLNHLEIVVCAWPPPPRVLKSLDAWATP